MLQSERDWEPRSILNSAGRLGYHRGMRLSSTRRMSRGGALSPLRGTISMRLAARRPLSRVLVKANVSRLLEAPLRAAGFNILNAGRAIYFPAAR